MKHLPSLFLSIIAVVTLLATPARAATVAAGTGYSTGFDSHPPASDWATMARAGGASDSYSLDTDVNATITSSAVSEQTTPDVSDPPGSTSLATWSSTGLYLQTRATGNRYTVLMGKFVNNTGSNATEITISYQFTITGGGVVEESGLGTRVYYSLTGLAGSWTNLPALNSTESVSSSVLLSTSVALKWVNGTSLYLLWADDNARGAPSDSGNQIDDFSLQVTGGAPPGLECALAEPAEGGVYLSGAPIRAAATVIRGTAPYTVEYFTNSGPGNTVFESAGTSGTEPYEVSLGGLVAGTYNIYGVVTDSAAGPEQATSATNTFAVADPLTVTLTAPADEATFEHTASVGGAATVSGGIGPYAVQFYLDGAAAGGPVSAAPYEQEFGVLFVGEHAIGATVTDATGWVSNAPVHTIHVAGPVAVLLDPPDGTAYNYGQPVVLQAMLGGGSGPYTAQFYTNGQLAGSLSAAPFALDLGVLPEGSYASHVQVTDSSSPVAQEANSTTNVISVLPNPLVATLISPIEGQTVATNQSFQVTVSATVSAPVTVSGVQFFMDGLPLGTDNSLPYTVTVGGSTAGEHRLYAVATDSLGRQSYTGTNWITSVADPLANDNFANRMVLAGVSASVTGLNIGATTEAGEPSNTGFFTRWGATLWWSWTAPVTATARVDTFGSGFNTSLGIYTGSSVGALTRVAFNDNAPGRNDVSLVTFPAQAGTEYHIQVGGMLNFGPGATPAMGPIELHVQVPPTVALTAPVAGSVFVAGSSFLMSATASSPVGPVTGVDFYSGGLLLGSVAEAPYDLEVSSAPVGSNSLYAVVTDSAGQVAASEVVRVLVANLGVTLTSPNDGAIFLSTEPIVVSALGLLSSGSITNVEFFVDGEKFGEDDVAPFQALWSEVSGGSHRLTATGWDEGGRSYRATPVNIGVAHPLITRGSVWKYLDDGSDQGTAWVAPDFDDGAWASGPAQLGYGDGDEATVVNSGPVGNVFVTTYFRHTFVVSNVASLAGLRINIQRDDGAVVYFNGSEAGRFNMNAGPVNYLTYAPNANDDGVGFVSGTAPASLLVEGENVVAVEIHQTNPTSSDISFDFELLGVPEIIRNQVPEVAVVRPASNEYFLAPSAITVEATASDADGSVVKVELLVDGEGLGEVSSPPYELVWNNPPIGAHVIEAVATDDLGASESSLPVGIVVYDAVGTPVAEITAPVDGYETQGPTNVTLSAIANAIEGVAQVQFLADGTVVGSVTASPYSLVWEDVPFGTHQLTAVVCDPGGICGTSAPVSLTVTIPPTNTVAPSIYAQFPAAEATITELSSIQVIFSEEVIGVDAADLLVNDVPATGVSGRGSNYVFAVEQPPYGPVQIRWADAHGIADVGWPAPLGFYEYGEGARWSYDLIDRTAPTIAGRTPAGGATLTNLTQINVVFSEAVAGVDAADLLVNGVPAYGVEGAGANYSFSVSQPASGTVTVSWAADHGIVDLAPAQNAFEGTGPGAGWTYTLDAKTILVDSNSWWLFVKGTQEASDPVDAWRQPGFDDSGWSNAPAPFFFGDPYSNNVPAYTHLDDMRSNYTSIYLRQRFEVRNAAAVTELFLRAQMDDGMVVWINGVEVLRYNVGEGEIPYSGTALSAVAEQNGAPYVNYPLLNPSGYLVSGMNVIAIHALNESIAQSSDFGFNAQLYTYQTDTEALAPQVAGSDPEAGFVLSLSQVTVTFSEPVTGVEAADLLVNGVPAAELTSSNESVYSFGFPQPGYGAVSISWAADHGIVDLDLVPKPFNGTLPSSTWGYILLNANSPHLIAVSPAAGATVGELSAIDLTFSEPVTGVDAADLLINGLPAVGLVGSETNYTFTFPQPEYGMVDITWAADHGIRDLNVPPNNFDPAWPDHTWIYTLADRTPPVVTGQDPPAGTFVASLTELTVTFSEPVAGVSAGDLLVNGQPARSVSGGNTTFTFSFPQPNASLVEVSWAANHGIRDLATVPNAFDPAGPGASWTYTTVDSVAPATLRVSPPPFVTVRSLTQIAVTFDEAVTGIEAGDLLINGSEADQVSGTGAGPYTFAFREPPTGQVQVAWAPDHGIQDLAATPNAFGGGEWTYVLDPTLATEFAVRYVVHISLDGAGAAYLENYINSAAAQYPSFSRLVHGGASTLNARCDYTQSVTLPNHACMFTGRPVEQPAGWAPDTHHGLTFDQDNGQTIHNSGNPNVPYKKSVFDVVHDHGLSTAFLYSKQSLTIFARSWNEANGAADEVGPDNGSNKIDDVFNSTISGSYGPTAPVVDQFVARVETNGLWNYTFMHFDDGDATGHASGWGSVAYSNAMQVADTQLGRVLDAVSANPAYANQVVVIVTADHGGTGSGHFDATALVNCRVPLFLWGPGIPVGVDAYSLFSNRADPGTSLPGYAETGMLQPLRNGETGNLALMMMGLPLIPGSSLIPVLATESELPAAPVNLLASALGATQIALSWTDQATNETGFVIERSADGSNFVQILTLGADVTEALDTDLLANTTYYYRVQAINPDGASDFSNVASATTVPATGAPQAPSDLVASAGHGAEFYRSRIILRWRDRSDNEAGFVIERASYGQDFTQVGSVGANATLYVDLNLASATTYLYRVRSYNASGTSVPSNVDGDQTHPQNALVLVGEDAVFQAGAEGTPPISYQWHFMGVAIFGETNRTLTIAGAQFYDEGAYSVVVTDATGRTASNPAWLFVVTEPLIVEHPASQTNLVGSTALFRVVAEDILPLSYQWRKDGVPLPGAEGEELVIESVTVADQGEYDVVVRNDLGAVISRAAWLEVNRPPVAGGDLVYRFEGEGVAVEVATLLANDGDADGDPVLLVEVSAASAQGGTVERSGRYVFYTPANGYNGEDSFTYTVADGRGGLGVGLVTVLVTENRPPQLAPIPDLIAAVLTPLVFTNAAVDPNEPEDRLTFTLEAGAPSNAMVNPSNGVFVWMPAREQAPSTNLITVRVRDNGEPSFSDAQSFVVAVRDYVELSVAETVLRAGARGSLPLEFFSSAGLRELSCAARLATERLTELTVDNLDPDVASVGIEADPLGGVRLSFTAIPGRVLAGSRRLGRLNFTAAAGQGSAFVPVELEGVEVVRAAEGLMPTAIVHDGEVVVIASQPLLRASVEEGAGSRALTLYGVPGVSYTVEWSSAPADSGSWQGWQAVTLTGMWQVLDTTASANEGAVFFRVRE